jgi:hypothetical protein
MRTANDRHACGRGNEIKRLRSGRETAWSRGVSEHCRAAGKERAPVRQEGFAQRHSILAGIAGKVKAPKEPAS